MIGSTMDDGRGRANPWRIAAWACAGALLLVPLVAMQFTEEVRWDWFDFLFAGVLIGGVGLCFEFLARRSSHWGYRAGAGVALAAAFLLIWVNAAVGIIGSEGNPQNLMFGGVLALGLLGAFVVRFRPLGMARTMVVTALAQLTAGTIAIVARMGVTDGPWPWHILVLTGFFAGMWLVSAWLFRKAGGE
jgi:hypothetical protein